MSVIGLIIDTINRLMSMPPPDWLLAPFIAIIYLMIWATYDLFADKLMWKLGCKRGDKYFQEHWRNLWKYLFLGITTFITGTLVMYDGVLALKFFLYTVGLQMGGMEDILYFLMQGKKVPEKLPWLPPWLNTRKKLIINVVGFLFFMLTCIERFI